MGAFDFVLAFEFGEISPGGGLGDAEDAAEFGDGEIGVALEKAREAVPSFFHNMARHSHSGWIFPKNGPQFNAGGRFSLANGVRPSKRGRCISPGQ